jgi:hypothetical protein
VLNTAKFHVQFGRDECIPSGVTAGQFHCCCDIPRWDAVFEAAMISAIQQ